MARLGAFLAVLWTALPALAQPFEFVALGDMPYRVPDDYPRVERVIAHINAVKPAFSLHIGDIKSGSTPCSDELLNRHLAYFATFEQPVVYSPGDNEWTDCHRERAGRFEPRERLEFLRKAAFAEPKSLGRTTMPLVRQADVMPAFATYVENARWVFNNVLFVSVHIVGSNNNFERSIEAVQEYFARNTANLAWIDDAFRLAAAENRAGLVFGLQADMWYAPEQATELSSGYRDSLAAFTRGAVAYGKPVLLIQGDSHVLKFDQPLKVPGGKATLANVFRLQVMGEGELHAVRVTVDPADPSVFGVKPLMVWENRPAK